MENNTTSALCWLGALSLLLGSGCDLGADPDPRLHRPTTYPLVARSAAWEPAAPEVAAIDPAAPAPQAETVSAAATATRPCTVALGFHAQHVVDAELQRGFAALPNGSAPTFLTRTDRDALDLMLLGQADFAVVAGPLSARELEAGLQQTRIGLELFALAVAPDSPVRSLTRQQVRQIFTGQVDDWRHFGFAGGKLLAVAPSERTQAERSARVLIPGDGFAETVVRVPSNRHVADQILQHPGAIGIVTLAGEPVAGMKLVAIDWCPPNEEAFAYGTYPFGVPVHLVTAGPVAGEARRFLGYLRSDAVRGQLAARLSLP
ncbi:MAG: substrate-binding domain-containing protein [Planctomycetes bacterium]|nr:substrate-binding domain-containing protein [Planctomycetota bacterium]